MGYEEKHCSSQSKYKKYTITSYLMQLCIRVGVQITECAVMHVWFHTGESDSYDIFCTVHNFIYLCSNKTFSVLWHC